MTTDEAPPSSRRAPATAPPASAAGKAPKRIVGRMELRLTAVLILMAAAPLVIGIVLAVGLARHASDLFYNPRVREELEASLHLYRPLVREIKQDMRHRADAIAAREPLRAAAAMRDEQEVARELMSAFDAYGDKEGGAGPDDPGAAGLTAKDPPLVSLVAIEIYGELSFEECLEQFAPVATSSSDPAAGSPSSAVHPEGAAAKFHRIGRVDRGLAVDERLEDVLVLCRPLGEDDERSPMLVATFATDRARIDHQKAADDFFKEYQGVEVRRDEWVRLNVGFFSALLGATILIAAAVGWAFARSVSRRVANVAEGARRVAGGDLQVRVPEEGTDEIANLASSFNRMLGEVERSRARIEYLQRIGAWQDMARRLAHEIKNPLTPIQLAVEECHHKYKGDDPKMRKLLDTTLEIVTEEVGTLRRLVSEFSDFARLPRAKLVEEPLAGLLKDVRPALERLGMGTEPADVIRLTPSGGHAIPVRVTVDERIAVEGTGGDEAARAELVAVDRQMIRKALDNLVRNAVQAIRAAGRGHRVSVHATLIEGGDSRRVALDVDDDGPGVPSDDRARIFDPYVTTRTEGTGLGLAIVKKIVIEHGGSITCDVSPLGGARFRIVLPKAGSAEARAALEEAERGGGPPSSPRSLE